MDTVSSSISSALKVSATTIQPNSSKNKKIPNFPPQQPISASRRTSISTASRRSSFTHTTSNISRSFSSVGSRRTSPPRAHQRAATGYAAALVDIAQCNSALEAVEKDVRRFSRLLGNNQLRAVLDDPSTAEAEKGRVVKEVVERGRFDKRVVGMVRMLVEKKKPVELVAEVMEEFHRIYHQLTGIPKFKVNNPVAHKPSFAC